VNRVGQNLVRNSDARVPFTIQGDRFGSGECVLRYRADFFTCTPDLILRANEESELPASWPTKFPTMTARTAPKTATKGDIMQLASIPAMIFIPYSWAGWGIYQGLNLAIPLTFLKFSRDQERESRFLSACNIGTRPDTTRTLTVTFFERIQADEKRRPGTIPKVSRPIRQTPSASKTRKKRSRGFCPQSRNISLRRRSSIR